MAETIANLMEKASKFFDDIGNITPEQKAQLMDHYFKHAKNPVLSNLVDFVASKKEAIQFFEDIFTAALPANLWIHIQSIPRPLMLLDLNGKFDQVQVFPNIIVDAVPYNSLREVSILEVSSVFSEFIKAYEKDMSGTIPGADKKWETKERINRRIEQSVETSLAAALTNYFKLEEKGYKAADIRDFAVKIEAARKPSELLFADRPEDFMRMYDGTGPSSCMTTGRDSFRVLERRGITAASFYAYFPWTRGAYLMKRGKVVARTILYADPSLSDHKDMGFPNFTKENGKGWKYGYVYKATLEDGKELIKALTAQGIGALDKANKDMAKGNNFLPPEGVEFNIPAITDGKEIYAPFPFFDNMDYHGTGFNVRVEDNMFIMAYGGVKKGTLPANNCSGYIKGSHYKTMKCEHCGVIINARDFTSVTTVTGEVYCCEDHAKDAGFTKVYQGNTHSWLILEQGHSFIQTKDGKYFTNLMAAYRNGYGFPILETFSVGEQHIEDLVGYTPGAEESWADRYNDGDGAYCRISNTVVSNAIISNLVPVEVVSTQRVVQFDPEANLVA